MDQLPVFVYGTLRPGRGNYGWALSGRTVNEEPATLAGAVMHHGPGFPYVVTGDGVVVGDLIEVDPAAYDDVMASLDALEGYRPARRSNLYDRVVTSVRTATGPRKAWVYLAARVPAGPLVASGEWPGPSRDRVA